MTAHLCEHVVPHRDGFMPCNEPAVASIEDHEFGVFFHVCQQHLSPAPQPIAGQFDIFGGEVQ